MLYNSPWEKSIGLILIVLTRYDHQPAIRDISSIPKEIGDQSEAEQVKKGALTTSKDSS
jgi:hypothetical protein